MATSFEDDRVFSILLLEDGEGKRTRITEELRRVRFPFALHQASTGNGLLTALAANPPTVVLSDHRLAQIDGIAALRIAREAVPEIPFIYLSDSFNEDVAMECIRAGASDFVVMNNIQRLPGAIRHAVSRIVPRPEDLNGSNLAHLASFPELNPQPVVEMTSDGEITYMNPAAYAAFPHIESEGIDTVLSNLNDVLVDLQTSGKRSLAREVTYNQSTYQTEFYFLPEGRLLRVYFFDTTHRRKAEQEMFSAETKFRDLVEQSLVGIYIIQGGTFSYVNPRMAEMFGYTQDEIIGKKNVRDLVYEPDRETVETNIQKRLQGEIPSIHYGFRGRRKDDKVIDIEVHGTRTQFNGLPAVIGTALDITDRKRAEQLQSAVYRIAQAADVSLQLEDLYPAVHRIILEVMDARNFYIALYDPQTQLLTFEYFIDEIDTPVPPQPLGKGLTEYILRTGKSLLCTEDVQQRLQDLGEADLIGVPSKIWLGVPLIVDQRVIGVMTVQHYNDAYAFGERELHILEFVSSQIARAIDRKRTEERLRKNEERYRKLFEEDLTGDFICLPDGQIQDCNQAFARIFGFASPEEARSHNASILYPSAKECREHFELVRAKKKLEYHEAERRSVDGRTVHTIENLIGEFEEDGTLSRIKGYIFDNTDRKRLEEQLLHAQKMEAVGQLASGVAHDFNNVMSVALTASQMIKRHSSNAQTERYAKMIEDATLRGAAIAKQLLQFSRAETAKLRAISLSQIIQEIKKLLEHSFPKNVVIDIHIDVQHGVILGDAGQIHQMLLNLCINARDAIVDRIDGGPEGHLDIALRGVSAEFVQKKFGEAISEFYVELSIRDNGTGINEEIRRRMFDPFFTTKRAGKGTGLGLSIVHGIVKSHRGFIDVESEFGRGTQFLIYLPALPHGPVDHTELDADPAKGKGETVLLIEDEELLRELVREVLVRAGYTVLEAKNGEEGLAIYKDRQNEIRLVLTDMGLPRMSGDQVFRQLQKANENVKVIFATGYIQEDRKAELLLAGGLDVVHKPYTISEVLGSVRRALDA